MDPGPTKKSLGPGPDPDPRKIKNADPDPNPVGSGHARSSLIMGYPSDDNNKFTIRKDFYEKEQFDGYTGK
jgi:hypothetical protein